MTLKATIWAVIVVPMFAPMITDTDCDMDMRPADMKPTTSTVVTEEDWMTAVTKAPVTAPMNRLVVSFSRMSFIRSPATALSESAIWFMPKRKSARPPRSPIVMVPHAMSVLDAGAAMTAAVTRTATTPSPSHRCPVHGQLGRNAGFAGYPIALPVACDA